MRARESRPGVDSQAASSVSGADVDCSDIASRPRCVACGHVLTAHRSLARGFGRVCWARTVAGHLDQRRDAVGASLARLAGRVAGLEVRELALVQAGVCDVLEALDAEEVAR